MSAGGRAASGSWVPALMFAVAMLGLAVALVAALAGWRGERRKSEALSREADSLRREVLDLRDTVKRSGGRILDTERRVAALHDGLDEGTIHNLKLVGFTDPVNDIKADLAKHRELIPRAGEIHGDVGFYSPDHIRILNGRWVMALWNGGEEHEGWMLLEYRLEGTRIYWKRLAIDED
jgi:hypothetical protein